MIDELESLLKNVDFEIKHFDNKKHMTAAARQRMLRQLLSVDYEVEFNQFLSTFHGEHMGLKEFEADRIAFYSSSWILPGMAIRTNSMTI